MSSLRRELRKNLENVVIEARDVAEEAAEKAIKALAIAERDPHRSMSAEQKVLRARLRAHGRQLGDRRNSEKGTQETDHLVVECAYEHWHRMLFARFLAENELLLDPENGVACTIDVVKELAQKRKQDWVALAGGFAVRMLPQVFRQDDPVLEIEFAPEDRKLLEELLASLPVEVFTASDSLGWTYQFWQTERKNEINESGDKIGADELPAVTQLFTEDYMVDFLLDNTLGAWHAGKVLGSNPQVRDVAKNEDELRKAVALPGVPWKYLRFIRTDGGTWAPAAGTFDGWPNSAKDLKCLDPCMGSGHFVVAMFERLVALRIAEGGVDEGAAVAAVIRENLFGLEIDQRCTQIAAFSLALAAWRRVGHRPLPAMNLACSGLAPNAKKQDWLQLTDSVPELRFSMSALFDLFEKAPLIGSLINPRKDSAVTFAGSLKKLESTLGHALAEDTSDDTIQELAAAARGLADAARILADQFTLVSTNVPYLGRGKQNATLREYCDRIHPRAKADLATCFVERCIDLLAASATTALVTPQNWLYLDSYKNLRTGLLHDERWNIVAKLGSGAFETIGGEVVNVVLVIISRELPLQSSIGGLDATKSPTAVGKAHVLLNDAVKVASQEGQLQNPDARITLDEPSRLPLLGTMAVALQGISPADFPHFGRYFWEVLINKEWLFWQSTIDETRDFGGRELVLWWNEDLKEAVTDGYAFIRGMEAWGKRGIVVRQMSTLPVTFYTGERFDTNCAVIVPTNQKNLGAIWAYCSSDQYRIDVRQIDKKLNVTNATLVKVPFDLSYWSKIASKKYPHGLPKPFSSDPTQWLFDGHPRDSDQALQVAVARLLGYRWPRQTGSSFPDCAAVGSDGLEAVADSDGIVCLSASKGEAPAHERLRDVLALAYRADWSARGLEVLLRDVGFGGRSIIDWLRDGFFEQHCAVFQQRPFIWHIWDGERDGFHALVNYHRLVAGDGKGRSTLEKLTYSYLGDWITRQRAEQQKGTEGADAKLAAAVFLQDELKKVLAGEPPHDLFVRWKPLKEQAMGWAPDVNDGIRMNIRPFMSARTLNGKSILRKAPKIKWGKDRGTEPERAKLHFPWFWNWDGETEDFDGGRNFDGNRWNDVHYSNKMKQAARTGAERRR